MKNIFLIVNTAILYCTGILVCAAADDTQNFGSIASTVTGSLGGIAQLITAGSYVGGMGFAVAAVVGFKAHKDNPTQSALSKPIVLLFVAIALIFIPNVFSSGGATLFGSSANVGNISGLTSF
ncbi:type IV secretion protein IcmD [Gammaproteobacteria bacterium]|nr:type IV secretion protein IcmD [Gammaproteobacteria bacterium]